MGSHDRAVGRNIAAIRHAREMTQADLAERLGVAQTVVSATERGARRISIDDIFRFAAALDVPAVALLRGLPGFGEDASRSRRAIYNALLWAVQELDDADSARSADDPIDLDTLGIDPVTARLALRDVDAADRRRE